MAFFEQLDHIPAQNFPGITGIDDASFGHFAAHATDELLRDIPTDIGLDEQHFEIFIEFLIDRFAIEKATDLAENALARLRERLFHLRIWFGAPLEESVEDHGVSPEYNGGRMDRHWVDRRGYR